MDRVPRCGRDDDGSIPSGCTWGEVAKWSTATVSKTVVGLLLHRGFESHPLRPERSRRALLAQWIE